MGPREEYLRHLVAPRKVDQRGRNPLAGNDASLYVQIARKVQVALDGVALGLRQRKVAVWLHRDSETLRAEEISDTLGAANEHRSLGICRNQDEDPVALCGHCRGPGGVVAGLCSIPGHPVLHFMRRLP